MREPWKRLHFHTDRDPFLGNDLRRIQYRRGRFNLEFLGQVGSSILRFKAGSKSRGTDVWCGIAKKAITLKEQDRIWPLVTHLIGERE
jgi:hypothetical protein